jgi:hypothetical protein
VSLRAIGRELGWSASTVSREVRRNRDEAGRYRPFAVGMAYDGFGRTPVLPSADTTTKTGDLSVGYYTNDLVRTQTVGAAALTWSLDAAGQFASWTESSGRVCPDR